MIGVGITTHNRPEMRNKALAKWRAHLPTGARLVIVDDASQPAVAGADFRFSKQVGIAKAKNKCLELLADCDHIFLADDDTYPLTDDWWRPYVESPEPHLMFIFHDGTGPLKIYEDTQHTAWSDPRGCLLYIERRVLDVVGGMDPAFGLWGYEHVDWSNRIQNAGLTSWRFMDVVNSDTLIRCDDIDLIERSISADVREKLNRDNAEYYRQHLDSSRYVEFRQQRDVVLTCWQHAPDPQRGNKVTAVTCEEAAAGLRSSITGADFILLGDDDTAHVRVAMNGDLDIYNSRWAHYRTWLRDHPEVRFAWFVDTNDVVMQRAPWDEMQPGVLYIGWEPELVGCPWMVDRHRSREMVDFITTNRDRMLLNCGVIGGDRRTMLEFLTHWARLVETNAHSRSLRHEQHDLGTDMAPANFVAYTYFHGRLVTGPRVATVFKADQPNTWSWWKHK